MKLNIVLKEQGLYIAWMISVVATLGSLYFSEIAGYIPCALCWFQRIFMYPQVVLLGIAAVRRDFKQAIYIIPMSIIGGLISTYHYIYQKTDLLDEAGAAVCGQIPCNGQYINWLGFITIPFLALTAFVFITIVLIMTYKASKK